MLGRQLYDDNAQILSSIAKERNVEVSEINKKISADILIKCNKRITWKQAGEWLMNDRFDLSNSDVSSLANIDLKSYSTKSLALTKEQEELFNDIDTV